MIGALLHRYFNDTRMVEEVLIRRQSTLIAELEAALAEKDAIVAELREKVAELEAELSACQKGNNSYHE